MSNSDGKLVLLWVGVKTAEKRGQITGAKGKRVFLTSCKGRPNSTETPANRAGERVSSREGIVGAPARTHTLVVGGGQK